MSEKPASSPAAAEKSPKALSVSATYDQIFENNRQ